MHQLWMSFDRARPRLLMSRARIGRLFSCCSHGAAILPLTLPNLRKGPTMKLYPLVILMALCLSALGAFLWDESKIIEMQASDTHWQVTYSSVSQNIQNC